MHQSRMRMGNQECRMSDETGAKRCRKCAYSKSGSDWGSYTKRGDSLCGSSENKGKEQKISLWKV